MTSLTQKYDRHHEHFTEEFAKEMQLKRDEKTIIVAHAVDMPVVAWVKAWWRKAIAWCK